MRSNDLDDILTEACRLVGEALGTDLAKVVELREDGRTLIVRAGVGWKPGVVGKATITLSDNTSESLAIKTGAPVISPDIETETRFEYPTFLTENGVRAVANVPIIGGKDRPPYGILQVDSREPRAVHRERHHFSQRLRQPACGCGGPSTHPRGFERQRGAVAPGAEAGGHRTARGGSCAR